MTDGPHPAPTAPLRVLFVCTANICRSAYASVRATQLLGDQCGVRVSSAGIFGWRDAPMDEPMAAEARVRGADPSGFRSRRLTVAMVEEADLILTADRGQRDFIVDEWPWAFRRTFTLTQFVEVLALTPDLGARELLAEAAQLRRPARPSGDVLDPYRRGPEAAGGCAARLDGLLTELAPRLRLP